MTMGVEDHYQIEEMMEKDLESHHHEMERIASAVNSMGDAMPALGIVAAVLGVITTMGSITEPPAVLGSLIGAALVGTFSGVLISYGFITPIGKFLGMYFEDEGHYNSTIKVALLAHLKGNAPVVSVEFARVSAACAALEHDLKRYYGGRQRSLYYHQEDQERRPWRPSRRRVESRICRFRDRDDGVLPVALATAGDSAVAKRRHRRIFHTHDRCQRRRRHRL
jgi:hypothetical protein